MINWPVFWLNSALIYSVTQVHDSNSKSINFLSFEILVSNFTVWHWNKIIFEMYVIWLGECLVCKKIL